MPVRKVSNWGGNIIGRFPSLKLKRMVDYESLIERDFLYLLDFEQDIQWFCEQPVTIAYEDQGRLRHYTPDFYVLRGGPPLLVECKPEPFVTRHDLQVKFAVASDWCLERGWAFQVITDQQIRCGYRLRNIKQLSQFARYPISTEVKRCVHTFLASMARVVTITEVIHDLAPQAPQSLLIPLYHMAFHHEVILPLDEAPLSVHSSIRLPGAGEKARTYERSTL